jgi:hypothetical protein
MEAYVDTNVRGNLDPEKSWDRDTARSRHVFTVMYAGCPILWKSQLQIEITSSSTESVNHTLDYCMH